MNASMKASQFPCSHWMTTSSFILNTVHRLLQGLRPLANTRRSVQRQSGLADRQRLLAVTVCRLAAAPTFTGALRWDNRRA
jgi:hypothetical protein